MNTQDSEKSQKTVSARRRLFQILAVGGTAAVVLPEKWVKPVVDAVIVPAHAAGSVVRVQGIFGNQSVQPVGGLNLSSPLERFAGMLIGSAHAITLPTCGLASPNNTCISFVIPAPADSTVQVFAEGTQNSAVIYPNNVISDVTVGSLSFSSLTANSTYVSGLIGSPNCVSEAFSFPRQANNACIGPF